MRWIPIALLGVHGLIHLMGFAKAFGYGLARGVAAPVVTEADLARLPDPVQRYLRVTRDNQKGPWSYWDFTGVARNVDISSVLPTPLSIPTATP